VTYIAIDTAASRHIDGHGIACDSGAGREAPIIRIACGSESKESGKSRDRGKSQVHVDVGENEKEQRVG
jgi:hypothetical protein